MEFYTFTLVVITLTALYNLTMSLIMHTSNFGSALVFKVIPFFLGLALVTILLKLITFF